MASTPVFSHPSLGPTRQKAIEYCKPGRAYKDIGGIIEDVVTKAGYTTVREFCGHGVGKVFHTTPNVLHFKCVGRAAVDCGGLAGLWVELGWE